MSTRDSTRRRRSGLHLPTELMIELLSRLPVKSLLRFTSVCKIWYSLITNPSFALKQYPSSSTSSSRSSLLVHSYNERNSHVSGLSLLFSDCPPVILDMPFVNVTSGACSVVGVSNGIVCVSTSTQSDCPLCPLVTSMFLCNPATRQFREIPPPPSCWNDREGIEYRVILGFGFDPSAVDHKLIRIVIFFRSGARARTRTELYSMSTDTWREIDGVTWPTYVYPVNNRVHTYVILSAPGRMAGAAALALNGLVYWKAIAGDEFVLSFHLADEVIQTIRTPPGSSRFDHRGLFLNKEERSELAEFNDKLALATYRPNGGCFFFDVWLLDDNQASWIHQFKVGPLSDITRSMRSWEIIDRINLDGANNGEFIVQVRHSGGRKGGSGLKLFLYDVKSQGLQNLSSLVEDIAHPYNCYLYTQTLLSVKKNKELTY